MPQSKHLNYYGFLGLFVALASVASFIILKNKDCSLLTGEDYPKLEIIQITGTICGAVLFVLSFFNIAGVIYDIKPLFFAAIVAILIIAGVMFWGAFIAFSEPCTDSGIFGINSSVFEKNSFKAEDGHNIAILVLNVLAGMMLTSIGFTFGKRL